MPYKKCTVFKNYQAKVFVEFKITKVNYFLNVTPCILSCKLRPTKWFSTLTNKKCVISETFKAQRKLSLVKNYHSGFSDLNLNFSVVNYCVIVK